MKTQVTFTQKLWYVTILMVAVFAFNPMYGQSTSSSQKGKIIKDVRKMINFAMPSAKGCQSPRVFV